MKKISVLFVVVLILGMTLLPTAIYADDSTYAETIFDQSNIIEIDIQMDEEAWNQMIATASNEEYSSCNVVVNGVLYENVGIRPKGNSSMSSVTSRNSERYSWRIKFDKYEKKQTCDGLDVLILNNGFKDPGELREAIAYDMYQFLDADASLYNYAVVSLNGEYFGVYLALECVDESFAERNYGEDYGKLYKPDVTNMNKGNDDDGESEGGSSDGEAAENGNEAAEPADVQGESDGDSAAGESPAREAAGEVTDSENTDDTTEDEIPAAETAGEDTDSENSDDITAGESQAVETAGESTDSENTDEATADESPAREATGENAEGESSGDSEGFERPEREDNGESESGESDGDSFGGMGGSTDVMALNYVDDNLETYQDIWDSEKFKSDDEDHARVVEALKHVCQSDNLKDYIDVENILKYFAIQTYIYNHDGLTGNVSHNYYLYEQDGKLNLIPWDMNESFTVSGNGSDYVNFPIDTPFTASDLSSRSFFMAMLEDEECLALYHEYLRQLSEEYALGGAFDETLERIESQIAELVKTDPTSFSTYEEFESAAASIEDAVKLRAQSVLGQLDGSIPSTRDGQSAEPEKLLDTSGADFSGLSGGMSMGMGF